MQVACQCRLISFSIPQTPSKLYICHCHECRTQSGGPCGSSAVFEAYDFPKEGLRSYEWTADSGRKKQGWFCERCGVRILHMQPSGGQIRVKAGVLEQEKMDWKTAEHLWACRAVIPIPEGAIKHERNALNDPREKK